MKDSINYTPQLKKLNKHFGGSNPPFLLPVFQSDVPFNPALFIEIDNLAKAKGLQQNLVSDYYWIVTEYLRFAEFKASLQPISDASLVELKKKRKAFKLSQARGPGLSPSITVQVGKDGVELTDHTTLQVVFDFLRNHEEEVKHDSMLTKRTSLADDGHRTYSGEIDEYLVLEGIEPGPARYKTIGYLLALAAVPVSMIVNRKHVPNSHLFEGFDEHQMTDTVKSWVTSYKNFKKEGKL